MTVNDSPDDPADESGPAIGATGARFGGAPRRRRTARRKGAEADLPPAAEQASEVETEALPVTRPSPVPRGGARFHGAPVEASVPVQPAPAADASDGLAVGLTGARFGGAREQDEPHPAPPPAAPSPAPLPEAGPPPESDEPVTGRSAIVRPYVFTRGRTRAAFELSIETLVSAVPQATRPGLTAEHHAVLGLCQEPRSVAEVAACVGVPLGVARVLVGDLAVAGAVAVHHGAGAEGPDLAVMQRVLTGLRKL